MRCSVIPTKDSNTMPTAVAEEGFEVLAECEVAEIFEVLVVEHSLAE